MWEMGNMRQAKEVSSSPPHAKNTDCRGLSDERHFLLRSRISDSEKVTYTGLLKKVGLGCVNLAPRFPLDHETSFGIRARPTAQQNRTAESEYITSQSLISR